MHGRSHVGKDAGKGESRGWGVLLEGFMKRRCSYRPEEVREQVMWIIRERAFQAEETCAKALRLEVPSMSEEQ